MLKVMQAEMSAHVWQKYYTFAVISDGVRTLNFVSVS